MIFLPPSRWHRLTGVELALERVNERVNKTWDAARIYVDDHVAESPRLAGVMARMGRWLGIQSLHRVSQGLLHVTLKDPHAARALPAPLPHYGQRRRLSILLVEPQPAMRHTLTRLLQHAGVPVLPVADDRSAIEVLEVAELTGITFDVVVSDVWLGGDGSSGLVHELRARNPGLPILLICSSTSELPPGPNCWTTPVLPLVDPPAWSQLARGIERAVRVMRFARQQLSIAVAGSGYPDNPPAR